MSISAVFMILGRYLRQHLLCNKLKVIMALYLYHIYNLLSIIIVLCVVFTNKVNKSGEAGPVAYFVCCFFFFFSVV